MEVPLGNWGVGKEMFCEGRIAGSLRRWKGGSERRGFPEVKQEMFCRK